MAAQGVTITDWYKQSVYDVSNNKLGEIVDLLLMPDGKINLLVVWAQHTVKDGNVHLTLDTTEDVSEVRSASQVRT